jgi:hypothetical protein
METHPVLKMADALIVAVGIVRLLFVQNCYVKLLPFLQRSQRIF